MQKRSRKKKVDLNELAALITDQATTAQPPEEPTPIDPDKNPAAVALGKLGGPKGGKNRWKGVSKAKRTAIAKKAARARWKGNRKKD